MKRAIAIALLASAPAFAGHVPDYVLVGQTEDGKARYYWDRVTTQRGRTVQHTKMPDTVVYVTTELRIGDDKKMDEGHLIDCTSKKFADVWTTIDQPGKDFFLWDINDSGEKLEWKPLDQFTELLFPLVCK